MHFIADYFWTPFFVFVFGYLLIRMAGKKAVPQMNGFDLLVFMIVSNSIAEPVVSKNDWVAAWFSFVVIILYIVLSKLVLANKFKHILTFSPTVLIRDGKIDKEGLKKAKMNVEFLLGSLRVEGYTTINDVDLAMMEETGHISVIPKSDKRPLQPNDIQLTPSPTFVAIPLIIDGEVINHNLKFLQKSIEWLQQQMQAHSLGMDDLQSITLATYNQQGIVDFDIYKPGEHQPRDPYHYNPGNEN